MSESARSRANPSGFARPADEAASPAVIEEIGGRRPQERVGRAWRREAGGRLLRQAASVQKFVGLYHGSAHLEPELLSRFFQLEDHHWWFTGRRRIVLDQIERFAPLGRVLDLGCGTGGTLAALNGTGPSVGIDPSAEALGLCRVRGLNVALGSGMQLPFPDDHFGTVLALDVIEHVDDDVGLLREVRRVLRPMVSSS
ncbi:MAG: methyltransferase domain-containing protein [Dehalococcoidia bacterium]|nr:methyltransferase domain-containing protein [Dehalococcoidia bacterium]